MSRLLRKSSEAHTGKRKQHTRKPCIRHALGSVPKHHVLRNVLDCCTLRRLAPSCLVRRLRGSGGGALLLLLMVLLLPNNAFRYARWCWYRRLRNRWSSLGCRLITKVKQTRC
jgi:hypothetical protein